MANHIFLRQKCGFEKQMDFVFFIVFFQLAIDYPHTFLFEYFEIMYLSNKEIPKR